MKVRVRTAYACFFFLIFDGLVIIVPIPSKIISLGFGTQTYTVQFY